MSPAALLSPVLLLIGLAAAETPPTTPTPESAVVVIRTPSGMGSGFLVAMDGKKYIVTNQHVLMGAAAPDVHITFSDGTEAHPTAPQIMGDLDLARLELETDRPALECAAGTPAIGSQASALGNSLGAGVITAGYGTVKGVGANELEVDCDFVPGNSGGPILNAEKKVLGVATYIRLGEANETTSDTRYEKSRRFAVRLHDGMPWIAVPQWPVYAGVGATIRNAQIFGEEALLTAKAIATNTDLSGFKPRSQKVAAAIGDFNRLRSRISQLRTTGLKQRDVESTRISLTNTYRSAFQKLRDACAARIQELNLRVIPPAWVWIAAERTRTVRQLEALVSVLDGEIKADPPF